MRSIGKLLLLLIDGSVIIIRILLKAQGNKTILFAYDTNREIDGRMSKAHCMAWQFGSLESTTATAHEAEVEMKVQAKELFSIGRLLLFLSFAACKCICYELDRLFF